MSVISVPYPLCKNEDQAEIRHFEQIMGGVLGGVA